MSNDLSKQLCELCGIEYEKHEPVAATDGVIQAYSTKKLDFTKPENFVRLLELITSQTREQNLKTMLNHLKVNLYPYTEQTKQSIREAEWVYG